MPSTTTTLTDFVLPPHAYPATKPYAAFTTLLHRFDRYERQHMKLATTNLLPDAVAALYVHKHLLPQPPQKQHSARLPPLQRAHSQTSKSATTKTTTLTTLSSNLTIDTLGKRIMRAAAAELVDQRVALSKTQQVRMDLASIKAGVDSLLETFPLPQSHAYPTPLPPPARSGQRQRPQQRQRQQQQHQPVVVMLDAHRGNPNLVTPSERQKFIFVGRMLQQFE
ncbi:hypothetical protein HDU87_000059 [Geranomyces variabilis]|uniref:Uncharacterized protein n=1 Tax=Geranomyces variabilis TaxID=109894 RepID=A0AAD5TU43_9FUNG|nr:hypothetical protein HDU87_000059 [Geranomyces variabilis]